MLGRRATARLRDDKRGVVLIEFALIASVLIFTTFATIDLGMIMWTQSALQGIAADAARCGAIGASACSGTNTVSSYVKAQAADWVIAPVVNSLTINTSDTTCSAMSVGTFETVQIRSSYFASFMPQFLPSALSNFHIDVCASYATASAS